MQTVVRGETMPKRIKAEIPEDCIYHQVIPYHTTNQARMFFAAAKDLGYEAKDIKERAKRRFGKDCFNKLTKEEMKYLIDSLNEKMRRKMQ